MENLILVNKNNCLNPSYIPSDLEECDPKTRGKYNYSASIRKEALDMFIKLRQDALRMKYDIYVFSGFRSYDHQKGTFNRFLESNYKVLKEQYPTESEESLREMAYSLTTKKVALPGQSEHQTGLAIDITCFYNDNYDVDISNDEEIEWMQKNAHKYGFILRYPMGKEDITGYNFEPWHYRYVGEEYSQDISSRDYTLEEYYEKVLRQ